MIELEFVGAARTVTGSKHLIRTSRATVLLDCGLFQGHRSEANEKNRGFDIDTQDIDAIVLSHAHIDHSGALPCIYKLGYRGPIYTTHATRDLCAPMLMDTASILRSDAEHILKLIARGERDLDPVEPLYSAEDVTKTLELMIGLAYHKKQVIAPGITLSFLDAGHVLGSAICVLDIEDGAEKLRLAFTGDLGRNNLPILKDPEIPEDVDFLIMESTYGDRSHDPMEYTTNAFAEVIHRTYERGGRVLIPSFALERAQELIYALKKLHDRGKLPPIPIFIDSPLTTKITEVFKLHPECYDTETFALLNSKNPPFEFDGLEYIASVDDSKLLSMSTAPSIIISAGGMCEGGRILHHLCASAPNPDNTIVVVGFQAEHTLGRRIVERRPEIKIFGKMYDLNADVEVFNGFSCHADQNELAHFAMKVGERGHLKKIFLVHGELKAQEKLQQALTRDNGQKSSIPSPGERIVL